MSVLVRWSYLLCGTVVMIQSHYVFFVSARGSSFYFRKASAHYLPGPKQNRHTNLVTSRWNI